MRVNRQIRAPKIRVISETGEQVGIMSPREALEKAESVGLDLVEIAPNANPPVCKIIDYGKFRYQQTKKEKESKKSQHQVKVKEIKIKPNIDEHDFQVKVRRAREFIEKGNKVRLTCMFRGREMLHQEIGEKILQRFCTELEDIAAPEAPLKKLGRNLSLVIAPGSKKKA
ncbi:MAG: translation initiation factor IF-3 [Simkaniaceae bacterium]